MHLQEVEQLRYLRTGEDVLAVSRRDQQSVLTPSERDAIQVDAFHLHRSSLIIPIRNSRPNSSSDLAMTFSIVPRLSSSANSSTLVLFSLNCFICSTRRVTSARCSSVSCPDCQRESCSSKSQKSLRCVVNTCLIRLTVKLSKTCGLPLASFSVSYCSTSASSIPSMCAANVGNMLIGCHCGCFGTAVCLCVCFFLGISYPL